MAKEIKKKEAKEKKPSKVKTWFMENKETIGWTTGLLGAIGLGIFGIKKSLNEAKAAWDAEEERFYGSMRPVRVLHHDGNEEDGWLAPFDDGQEWFLPDTEEAVGRNAGTFDFSEFDWVHRAADEAAEESEE